MAAAMAIVARLMLLNHNPKVRLVDFFFARSLNRFTIANAANVHAKT